MKVEEFGFDEWADDLQRAGRDIIPQVKKVTGKTCLEIKKGAKKIVAGHQHIKHLGYSFNYEVKATGSLVTGEVGADITKGQGPLDFLIEEDNVSADEVAENGSIAEGPIPHWRPMAEKEVPLWEKYLEDAAVEAIGDR